MAVLRYFFMHTGLIANRKYVIIISFFIRLQHPIWVAKPSQYKH
jgi:hypothetical protein